MQNPQDVHPLRIGAKHDQVSRRSHGHAPRAGVPSAIAEVIAPQVWTVCCEVRHGEAVGILGQVSQTDTYQTLVTRAGGPAVASLRPVEDARDVRASRRGDLEAAQVLALGTPARSHLSTDLGDKGFDLLRGDLNPLASSQLSLGQVYGREQL